MAEEQSPQRQLLLQKIYLKDASLEVPKAPEIFQRSWKPQVDVDLKTGASRINDEGGYHVVLHVTITAKLEDDVAVLVEVQQAGVFQLTGFNEQELQLVLNTHCPHALFPYAREAVSDLAQRGGFQQLLLQPVNFDGLYQQHLARQQEAAKGQNLQ